MDNLDKSLIRVLIASTFMVAFFSLPLMVYGQEDGGSDSDSGGTTINTNTTSTSDNTNHNTNVNTNTSTSTNTNYNYSESNSTSSSTSHNTNNTTINSTSNNTNHNTNVSTSTSDNTNTNNNTNNTTYSGTSNNTNTNYNESNSNVNQSVNSNNTNNNTSNNTNSNYNESNSNSNVTSNNNNNNRNENINKNETTQKIEQEIKSPPPSAIAPSIGSSYSQDLCTVGIGGAVQTQIFGLSAGGSVTDENCERIKLSKTMYDMGMKVAAVSLMCQDQRVWDAMRMAGTPCPFEGKIGAEASEAWEKNPKKAPEGVDMPKTTLKDDKDTEYTVWTKEEFCAEYPEELVCKLASTSK